MAHHELRLGDLVLAPRPELLQAHLAHAGKRQFLIAGGRRRAAARSFHGSDGHMQLAVAGLGDGPDVGVRSEEHTSELQSLMRISYAVFCLKKKKDTKANTPQ